jgi:hypothetical protein
MNIPEELRITDVTELVPGALYCCFTIEPDRFLLDGALVWYSSWGDFYDADYDDTAGEEYHCDCDFWVRQGDMINTEYVELQEHTG